MDPASGSSARIRFVETVADSPRFKSAVFRLHGVELDGRPIIAKRSRREGVHVEQIIYERVLRAAGLPMLHYYGVVADDDESLSWIFLEEARGEPYSPDVPGHRLGAARWLATLHAATTEMDFEGVLPDRSLDHYLSEVIEVRAIIRMNLQDPRFLHRDLGMLQVIAQCCDAVFGSWDHMKAETPELRHCVVHGDFVGKNVRVRAEPGQAIVHVMDWETSGWGVPCADLTTLDAGDYLSAARNVWPRLSIQDIERLADIGRVFRYISAIKWACSFLAFEWASYALDDLEVLSGQFEEGVRRLGWR